MVFLALVLQVNAAEFPNPNLSLELISSEDGTWQTGTTLALRVRLQHPSGGEEIDASPWLLNPNAGWATAVSLSVKSATGETLSWAFKRSAMRATEALTLDIASSVLVGFSLDPAAGNRVSPGFYQVRARISAVDGTGWKGDLESEPVLVQRIGPVPPMVVVQPAVTASIYRGWPWGVRVSLEHPGEALRFPLPGGMGGWASAVVLEIRNSVGAISAWPFVVPRQEPDSRVFLEAGAATEKLFYRLPAAATTNLPSGNYTLVARFTRTSGDSNESIWSGTVESVPLPLAVTEAPLNPATLWRERNLLEVGDAVAEAQNLKIEAADVTIGRTRQIETIRRAASPLLRAEAAARRLVALEPENSQWLLLLAGIMREQHDKERSVIYARIAEGLAADVPSPVPDSTAGLLEPVPEEEWVDFPEQFLRESLETIPDVPDALLTPELRMMIAVTRGDGPEPVTLEEQDRFFVLDPYGQWAATARASSEYRASDYSAARATGAPDVPRYGDSPLAWASRQADAGEEWLELTFTNAVRASAVRVRQAFNPGAIIRIDLINPAGGTTTVYNGIDTNRYTNQLSWFIAKFPATAEPVARLRLTLDSARVKGWNEIDAVQLVAARSTPVSAPTLSFAPVLPGARTISIPGWPAGFVLQRASTLAPPDWTLHATTPPVTIDLNERAAFFRLIVAP